MISAFRRWLSKRKPIMIERSKVPVFLSNFAPIQIGAIAIFPFVFSRRLMSEVTKRHETIHFHQQIELLVIPFYLLYGAFWLRGKLKGASGAEAYMLNPFEVEAYSHEMEEDYLEKRELYSWRKYV